VFCVSFATSTGFYENRNKPPIFNQQNNLRKVESTGFMQVYKIMLMAAVVLTVCRNTNRIKDNNMMYGFRLQPGEDLRVGY
jgi:hypothetical protein